MDDFELYVVVRSPSLVRTAYLLTGDWGLAEDLVQEALAKVESRWSAVVRAGDPDPYVRRVMYNRSIDSWRRRRRNVHESPVESLPAVRAAELSESAEEPVVRRPRVHRHRTL